VIVDTFWGEGAPRLPFRPQNAYIGDIPDYHEDGDMAQIKTVSSSEFAGRFGQWSFTAQSAPVMVTNQKTGVVLGYFISAHEFEDFLKLRDRLPKAAFAWEMPPDLAAELDKPLPRARPELDKLMDD
jgi:hypothetical protein